MSHLESIASSAVVTFTFFSHFFYSMLVLLLYGG